jgi:hypothetical protein
MSAERGLTANVDPQFLRAQETMMLNRFPVFMIVAFGTVDAALAQATPPAAPEAADSGAPWLWIIIGLAIIAGLVWYFMRGRSRTTTAHMTDTSSTSGTPTGRTNVYDNDKRK